MELVKIKGKSRKRVGRGLSSGQGKTAGRGTKGQKSRSGFNLPNRHAGGESPLSLRLPKIPGFKSHKIKAIVLSFDDLSENFKDNEVVSIATLSEKGLVKDSSKVKILNNGKLTVSVKIASEIKISASAKKIIEAISVKEEMAPAETVKKPRKTTKKSE